MIAIRVIIICSVLLCATLGDCYAQKPELVVQTGHSDAVCSVAWSHDGRFIVSGSIDKTVKLWDGCSGREICSFIAPNCVYSVDWSPDGKFVASGCKPAGSEEDWNKSVIKVWDVNAGSEIRTLQGCSRVAWSGDGRMLAGGGVDNKGTEIIKLWDTHSWNETGIFTGHTSEVLAIAWSPDGKIVASGAMVPDGTEGEIKLWDIAAMKEIRTLHTKSYPRTIAWSPDGKTIAGGCRDCRIRLWDIESGKELHTFFLNPGKDGNYPSFFSVAFSPDGRYIAGGGWDICGQEGQTKLWEMDNGREVTAMNGGSPLAFSIDGVRLLYWNKEGTMRFMDMNTKKEIPAGILHTGRAGSVFSSVGFGPQVLDIAFDPTGKTLAAGSSDKPVKIWEFASGKGARSLKPPLTYAHSFSWSPDGKELAALGANSAGKSEVAIWDSVSGKKLHSFGYSPACLEMNETWSPTSKIFASPYDKGVKLWDPLSEKPIGTLAISAEGTFMPMAWKPDGKFLATGTGDKILLWNISSQKKSAILAGHSGITSLDWRPQGDLIASGCNDYTVKIWNVVAKKVINTLKGHKDSIWSLVWSPDGNTLASGSIDGTVRLWQTATGKELFTLKKLPGEIYSVDWSRDGRIVAAGYDDGTIILWDVSSGKKLATLVSFHGNDWVAFTPEGFFDGSPGGMASLNWRVGLTLFPVEAYFNKFHQPGLLQNI